MLPEPTEDDYHYEQRLADVHHKNEEAKKKNEKLQKLQNRVRFEAVEDETDFAKKNEKCLLILKNYRELVSTSEGHAEQTLTIDADKKNLQSISATSRIDKQDTIEQKSQNSQLDNYDEIFLFEKLPTKVIMQSAQTPQLTMAICHNEASYAIKKTILEKAKLYWKDALKDVTVNQMLTYAEQIHKVLE